MPGGSLLGLLPCNLSELEEGHFRQRVAQLGRLGYRKVQLQLTGDASGDSTCSSELIRALGVLYDTLSEIDPRTLVVPLARCAGWDEGAVSRTSDIAAVTVVLTPQGTRVLPDHAVTANQIILPPPRNTPSGPEYIRLPKIIQPGATCSLSQPSTAAGQQQQQQQHGDGDASQQPCVQSLAFDHVAVGGTFDRLHCGHELLLATTALVARKTVYIGVTADKLLLKKNHKELLQPYEQRRDNAVSFMQAVRPSLHIEAGPLSDPQEPTQAEIDPAMQAIVVSEETFPGAVKINEGRAAKGFSPLLILVVPVIGSRDPSHKLSSTQLRAQDAAALAVHS